MKTIKSGQNDNVGVSLTEAKLRQIIQEETAVAISSYFAEIVPTILPLLGDKFQRAFEDT